MRFFYTWNQDRFFKDKNTFLDNNLSIPLIRSVKSGIWQIALAAQIKSVLFINFFKLFAVLMKKIY